ncbi:hypothetical protein NIES2104_08160 [Leptolyngbya sp. NIES-2104]|nr:hypothetical protein NIES2104_08160 [Leptolyngbya sp. NIES-2104]
MRIHIERQLRDRLRQSHFPQVELILSSDGDEFYLFGKTK